MQDALFIKESKIDVNGFKLSFDQEEKIKVLLENLLKNSAVENVSLKLMKDKKLFEGILCCEAFNIPVGSFNRHMSLSVLLEGLFRRVNRECQKAVKYMKPKKSFINKPKYSGSSYSLSA